MGPLVKTIRRKWHSRFGHPQKCISATGSTITDGMYGFFHRELYIHCDCGESWNENRFGFCKKKTGSLHYLHCGLFVPSEVWPSDERNY